MRHTDTSIRPRFYHALAISGAFAAASVFCLAFEPSRGSAADWTIDGQVEAEGQYDDNKRLRTDNEKDAFGSIITPEFSITGRTELTTIEINPRLAVGLFTDDSDLNYFDQFVDIGITRQTQLGSFGLDSVLSNESTLETEVDDTGRFTDLGRRLGLRLGPFWRYSLTERDSVILRGNFTKVDYRSTNDLDDFTTYGGSAGYERQITLQDTVGATASYNHFENDDDSGEEADAFGLNANWNREVSERLSTSLSAGVRYVDSQGRDDSDQVGGTFNASIDWQADERTSLNAGISRGIEPSGSGNFVLRDRVRFGANYQAWQTVGFRLNSFFRGNSDSTDTGFSGDSNTLLSINPRVVWQFTQDVDLFAGYRFRWRENEDNDDAYSNTVMLGLTYRTPIWHVND